MIGVRTILTALLACVASACDRQSNRQKADDRSGEALAATPARQAPPYTVRELATVGRLAGFVQIDGPPPPDSVVQPTVDQPVCGISYTRKGIDARGNRAGGVIVWIDGIRSGKPLPVERRFEITNERCLLAPEVQTAIAGGTLNVRNQDAVEHRLRFARHDGGEVLTTIRETDEGQVVPDEHVLAKPGVLDLSCTVHPWTRGWIAVFDHPYFATSATDGSFSIDSIPPGRYQVRVWHPRLGLTTDSVTINAGQVTSATLRASAGAS